MTKFIPSKQSIDIRLKDILMRFRKHPKIIIDEVYMAFSENSAVAEKIYIKFF